MINSGTAAGIVFSGVAVMAFATAWRELYALFALVGALVTAWLWFAMPAGSPGRETSVLSAQQLARPGLASLCIAAFLMGASSTAIWTFGADLLRTTPGFPDAGIAIAWVMLGLGGLAGASSGVLADRFSVNFMHRAALLGMAFSYAMLGIAVVAPFLAVAAMALFGAAYITSSGILLIRGIALLPDRPDLGLGIPFLAVAIGQTVGAPLFGGVLDLAGPSMALSLFGAATCAAMFCRMEDAAHPGRK